MIGSLLVAAAIFGAGCYQSQVSLDKYEATPASPQQPAPALTAPQETAPPEQTPPPAPATTTAAQSSSTTMTPTSTMNEPLAFPGILPSSAFAKKYVHLQTTKGLIVFEILPTEGPKAASNFVYLTNHKFYDGLTFHRVVPGFVVQGGDPLGTGIGGPGYQFADDKVSLPYNEGIVAMANAGPNTNGSQFFIMLADNPLPPSYSIFGRVVKGMDIVKKIVVGDKMTTVTLESK